MLQRRTLVSALAAVAVALSVAVGPVRAAPNLEPPGPREFVRDLAGMIDDADERQIRSICDKLLTDTAIPIIVVTIPSMAAHGGGGMRIEAFARQLYDQWQIGHAKLGDKTWNYGILLLVSQGDRKARIELGAGWDRKKDPLCTQIMQEQIIPRFKQDRFSEGILAGVQALERMARGQDLPAKPSSGMFAAPQSAWGYACPAILVAVGALAIFSLIRSGSGGWAYLLLGGLMGALLYSALRPRRHYYGGDSFGGGGFSGGSFGGGFSGGGGATGSW